MIDESDAAIESLTAQVAQMTSDNQKAMENYATAISDLEDSSAAVGRATQSVMSGSATTEVDSEALIQLAAPYPKTQVAISIYIFIYIYKTYIVLHYTNKI